MQRVTHIKNKSASGIVIVGEKHATGGHGVFRVMDELGRLICGESSHQAAIRRGGWVGIDHREKVIALFRPSPVQANM